MKKKKYAFGGTTDPLAGLLAIRASRKGEDPGFIESPDTAIAQNNIMKAKAMQKANSNPWTQGLDILGSLAVQYGTSMMKSGMSSMGGGASAGTEMEGAGAMFNSDYAFNGNSQVPQLKAFGGKVKGSQVEVEGEEVGELPNGQLLEFKGPSHEAGGIDAILPGGTDIFSKRISIDGVSMADRKKKREKQANRISKRLNENSADPVLKNTSKRIQEVNEMEDAFDMNVQEMLTPKTKEKFAGGGTVPGYKAPDWMSNITMQDLTDSYGFVDSDILNTIIIPSYLNEKSELRELHQKYIKVYLIENKTYSEALNYNLEMLERMSKQILKEKRQKKLDEYNNSLKNDKVDFFIEKAKLNCKKMTIDELKNEIQKAELNLLTDFVEIYQSELNNRK